MNVQKNDLPQRGHGKLFMRIPAKAKSAIHASATTVTGYSDPKNQLRNVPADATTGKYPRKATQKSRRRRR